MPHPDPSAQASGTDVGLSRTSSWQRYRSTDRPATSAFGGFIFVATVAHDHESDLIAQTKDMLARLQGEMEVLGSGSGA